MFRFLIFRLSGRRAVSTMIGGVIILSLLLTALGTMVFVSQQNDQYQQSVNKMAQYDSQQDSENLVFNSPGLQSNSGLERLLGMQHVQYELEQLGGRWCSDRKDLHKFNRVRLHIPLRTQPNASQSLHTRSIKQTSSSTQVKQITQCSYICRTTVILPSSSFSKNTILIVTSRGNVFSFQWPIQILMGGQSQSAFSAGIMKIAYQYSQGPGT